MASFLTGQKEANVRWKFYPEGGGGGGWYQVQVPTGCGRQVVAKLSQLQRCDYALCELTRLLVSDIFADHTGDYAVVVAKLLFVCVAFCDSVLNLWDIFTIRNLTAI